MTSFAAEEAKKAAQTLGQDRGGAPVETMGTDGTEKLEPRKLKMDKLLPFYSIFKTKGKSKLTCVGSVELDINVLSRNIGDAMQFAFECKKNDVMCTVLPFGGDPVETNPKRIRAFKEMKKVLEAVLTGGTDMYTSVNRVTAFEKALKTKDGWEINYSEKVGKITINSQMNEMLEHKKNLTSKLTVIDGYLFVTSITGEKKDIKADMKVDYMKKDNLYFPERIRSQFDKDKNHLDYDIKIDSCKVE
jgi:hypothetical protein